MTDLVTERLILRPWDALDVKAVLSGMIAENPSWLSPFGHRLIIERTTSEVVGSLGLLWPPSDGRVEIGYTVHANVERTNPASARVLISYQRTVS